MTKCEREIYHATKIILKYNLVNPIYQRLRESGHGVFSQTINFILHRLVV